MGFLFSNIPLGVCRKEFAHLFIQPCNVLLTIPRAASPIFNSELAWVFSSDVFGADWAFLLTSPDRRENL